MGQQNGHNVPFLESVSLEKRKRKAMTRIKQMTKIFKKGNGNIYIEVQVFIHFLCKASHNIFLIHARLKICMQVMQDGRG